MNTEIIVVTIVCIISGWLLIGKLFNGNEKEARRLRWVFRVVVVGVVMLTLGVALKQKEVALIGTILLFLAEVTEFIRTE